MRATACLLVLALPVLMTGCTRTRLVTTPDVIKCVRDVIPECSTFHGCSGTTTVALTSGEQVRVSEIFVTRPDPLAPWDSLSLQSYYHDSPFEHREVPLTEVAGMYNVQRRWAFPRNLVPATLGASLGFIGGAKLQSPRQAGGEAADAVGWTIIAGSTLVSTVLAVMLGNRIVRVDECRVEDP